MRRGLCSYLDTDEVRLPSVGSENPAWMPTTEQEKEAVRQQMNRLLQTSHFSNSRRYPALFKFIVEETLEGRGEFLKERLLGVRVFGRPADYDTASDPIVRVTIAEIRKRIAQYYHEEAHELEMRIELTPGSYEPEFSLRRMPTLEVVETSFQSGASALESVPPEPLLPVLLPPKQPPRPRRFSRATLSWLSGAALTAVVLCSWLAWRWAHPSALDELWGPVLGNHQTITFCLPSGAARDNGMTAIAAGVLPADTPDANASGQASRSATFFDYETLAENVVFSDALATLRISNLLSTHNHDFRYRLTTSTTLDDLRQGPDILIGGLDNRWTLRALAPLRFRFTGVDRDQFWILDSKDPSKRDWGLNLALQYGAINRDYAIIARVHDEATGQVEVIVAGIGMSGTAAAGEFLIDPVQAKELRHRIGPGFRDHDFEAILSTDVVNGVAGPPKILSTAVW
jgi:hypothetical protein